MSTSQTADSYDEQWNRLRDFIRFNPGARHRRRLLAKTLKHVQLKAPTVIDAGCGLGFNVSAIVAALPNAILTGVDFSPLAIEGATNKYPKHLWKVVDLNSHPRGLSAHVVVCTEVIEHVDNPKQFISNLSQMVEDGGYLVLTTQSGKVHDTEKMVGHLRHFSANQLADMLRPIGYEIIIAHTWGWPGYVILKFMGNINAKRTMEVFGSGNYGMLARGTNYIAYVLSGVFSMSNSTRGSQIVVLAHKEQG